MTESAASSDRRVNIKEKNKMKKVPGPYRGAEEDVEYEESKP